MKVNCQVDNTDELLVMVKRSMKRQVSTQVCGYTIITIHSGTVISIT